MPDLVWMRLYDGRLWHVMDGQSLRGLCGKDANPMLRRFLAGEKGTGHPETTHVPPTNGWVCDRLQDPRRRPGDQLPGPEPDRVTAPHTAPASTEHGQEADL